MTDKDTEQVIIFEDLGFPIQTSLHKTVSPGDLSLTASMHHRELEIKLFLSGTALVEVDRHSWICKAGDILIINPHQNHSLRSQDSETRYHLLMVDPSFLLGRGDMQDFRYLKPFIESRIVFENMIRDDPALYDTVYTLFQELEQQEEAYELAVKGKFLQLIALLLRGHIQSVKTAEELIAQEKYGQLLFPAITYISSHLGEPLPLDQLASLCGITPKYFCRVFKLLTGMTSTAYILEHRIARAEALIRSTGRPLSSIAEEVGFQDPCYFSRIFRRLRGIPPSSIR